VNFTNKFKLIYGFLSKIITVLKSKFLQLN